MCIVYIYIYIYIYIGLCSQRSMAKVLTARIAEQSFRVSNFEYPSFQGLAPMQLSKKLFIFITQIFNFYSSYGFKSNKVFLGFSLNLFNVLCIEFFNFAILLQYSLGKIFIFSKCSKMYKDSQSSTNVNLNYQREVDKAWLY